MSPAIICPNCKHKFSPDEAFSRELEEKLKQSLRDEFNQKYLAERKKLEEKITEESGRELKLLELQLRKQKQELDKAREYELELRQKTRELEEKEKNLELEKQRQIDEEREKIQEDERKHAAEKYQLIIAEKDKKLADVSKANEELNRKLTQGSQQLQGEILELELEQLLKQEFPIDEIEEVKKGKDGADIIQTVRDSMGRECGIIVWESKRTKAFGLDWIGKLKENLSLAKGNVGVIVSEVLPKDVRLFAQRDGVYLTSFECVAQVAHILRKSLIDLETMRSLSVGKNEKIESLYRYITSSEFAQKIESMMETYMHMQLELETEKNAIQKIWAKREARIEKLKNNTIQIHGSLSGLIDTPMPEVKSLSFTSLEVILED
ncbi:DUF2130 domain-containing protein [Candidatus Daviesbacteria bacterium]|nr:DUF2130 domain-containing protein [Candidatus Daviesbacteria bacterium]